ncbi:MAG: ferredoxin family protein [Candidatus Heimdallarchaeota archaeon]|nr:ferredoxin family protein [Candidatus Heimdallarchaeota archaeon]
MVKQIKKIDVKDKAGVTVWRNDGHAYAHITIDIQICEKCSHHLCIIGCPTQCFILYDGKISFQYEDCTECGTCAVLCDQGSIHWKYPRGTYGIQYDQG